MNYFGYLDGVNGIKTGFTNGAGRCLVTSVSRDNFDIITVVLGADTKKIRTSDSIKLIEYTYKNYELVDLGEIIKEEFDDWRKINEKRICVYKGIDEKLNVDLGEIKYSKFPIEKDGKDSIYADVDAKLYFEAPIEQNTKIGNMEIEYGNKEIMNIDILTKNKIERKGVKEYFQELMEMYFFRTLGT